MICFAVIRKLGVQNSVKKRDFSPAVQTWATWACHRCLVCLGDIGNIHAFIPLNYKDISSYPELV